MVNRRINNLTNIDWLTIGIFLFLVFLGWINIYSAEYSKVHASIFDFSQRAGKQFIWIIAALVLSFLVILIDSRFFMYFAYPLYLFLLVLLVAVLFLGKEIHGSRAWFEIGFFRLQPSELAKVVTALALAKFLSKENVQLKKFRDLFKSLLIIFLPAFLVLLQPDTGSTLVFLSLIIVLYREGLPTIYLLIGTLMIILFIATLLIAKIWIVTGLTVFAFLIYFVLERRKKNTLTGLILLAISTGIWIALKFLFHFSIQNYVLALFILGTMSLFALIPALINKLKYIPGLVTFLIGSILFISTVDYVFNNILEPHQQKRINLVLGIEKDPLGIGYNVNQSKIAIGSGGFSGKGFLRGTQTKFNFVPEQSTDFIFCTVGEEWGFVGSALVVSLFIALLFRIIVLAERQKNKFNRIYGYGVFSIFFFHFLVNIGMTIGLVPVIGIPLPLISYGGSSLWAFSIMLFIFLKMDASRTEFL